MSAISLLVLSIAASTAWAETPLATLLQEFDANPKAFMQRLPEKTKKPAVTPFAKEMILDRAFIPAKLESRPGQEAQGRAGIAEHDKPENVVDEGALQLTNIKDLDKPELLKNELKKKPWSDYYWAFYNGQTAYRYADENFPNHDDPDANDWKAIFDYLMKDEENYESVDVLSPAEKYDLLVGDAKFTLTRQALSDGEGYYRDQGKVEDWMGLCHGWAPASYMMERPKRALKVTAADGTKITFYPSDIKALASLLWSKHSPNARFMGIRCDIGKAKTDEYGRLRNPDCFDVNPGAWHLAVVNQISFGKRPFVMDATFDYEVWNHPVVGYEITYFDPLRMTPVKKLKDAKVAIADFKTDRFAKYRDEKATHVVGVSMKVEYRDESMPSTNITDSADRDVSNYVTYLYDLELDADGKVIGGEWYYNAHPDFLWTFNTTDRALSPGDERLIKDGVDGDWNGKAKLPADWQEAAKRNSKGGSPLGLIVESLIRAANLQ